MKKIIISVVMFIMGLGICIGVLYLLLMNTKNSAEASECAVLIHGLGRGPASFTLTQAYLKKEGYKVTPLSYPSTKKTLPELTTSIRSDIITTCGDTEKIHIVTHSLGGIITRQILSQNKIDNLGYVVMLAPPNTGSEIVDTFKEYEWFEWINGPVGTELGTSDDDIPNQLPPVDFPLGIIAGSVTFNPLYSYIVTGIDDGKVSVEKTKVSGMSDHIIIPSSHTYIMSNPLSLAQIVYFLENGKFDNELDFWEATKKFIAVML